MAASYYLAAAATALAVVALLFAERTGSSVRAAVAKPLASTGFLVAAWHAGATGSVYGRGVLVALALSAVGDVLLLSRGRAFFLGGLASFLLAHIAFAIAFVVRGFATKALAGAALALAILAVLVWRWLGEHVEPKMRGAVVAYIVAITAMAALAVGTTWARPSWPLLAGALAFYASDLSVARDRFIAESFVNKAWGLPLYYAAQLLLAASVARS